MLAHEFQDYWHDLSEGEAHSHIFSLLQSLDNDQSYRAEADQKHSRLYGNIHTLNLSREAITPPLSKDRITFNVVQSVVDTAVSRIAKNRPRPRFLTSGGDFSLKRKAQLLEKFIEGSFYSAKAYQQAEIAFKDACIFGTGFLKVFMRDGKLGVERVLPYEVIVDDVEALYGCPRNLYQRKYIAREQLLAQFPEHRDIIAQATACDSNLFGGQRTGTQVMVVEAWHLPSGPDQEDGKHIICLDSGVLLEEEWDKDWFPFVAIRWNTRVVGFYGQGIAEQLSGIQLEINKLLAGIQRSMHLLGAPKVLLEQGSKIINDHLNNEIGGVITYKGTKPDIHVFQTVHPEVFQHLERLYQRAYELTGMSQMSAHSKKEPGLESGVALRTMNDIESERFVMVAKAYEQLFLDLAKIMIDLAKDYAEEEELEVKWTGKDYMRRIKWSEVDLEEDSYVMQVFPTNILPHLPQGRLQTVQEMIAARMLTPEDGLKLLEFPDLEAVQSLENAANENIDRNIEELLEGNFIPPEPFQNLGLGIKKTQQAYLKARTQGAPDDVLELLAMWIEQAEQMLKKAMHEKSQPANENMPPLPPGMEGMPPMPPPGAGPGGPPPGGPAHTPSGLIRAAYGANSAR